MKCYRPCAEGLFPQLLEVFHRLWLLYSSADRLLSSLVHFLFLSSGVYTCTDTHSKHTFFMCRMHCSPLKPPQRYGDIMWSSVETDFFYYYYLHVPFSGILTGLSSQRSISCGVICVIVHRNVHVFCHFQCPQQLMSWSGMVHLIAPVFFNIFLSFSLILSFVGFSSLI